MRPPPEFRKSGVVWKLKKGMYGLTEGARLWYDELSKALEAAGGRKLTGDPACFLFHQNGKFIGFGMVHVDDIILSGTPEFMKMMGDTLKAKFRISKNQYKKFSYIVMALRCEAGDIFMNQNQYIEELENVPEGIEEKFSSEKMKEFLKQVIGKLL